MTCAEVSERTIDFLYGELGAEDRRAFTFHLTACEACRAEVESFGSTLGTARVVLAANREEPPASVKEGVVKLTELVARRRGRPFRTLGAPVIPEDAGGLWKLLRRPWFFPVFAAASVIGLFFLAQGAIVKRGTLAPFEVPAAEPPEAAGAHDKAGDKKGQAPAAAPAADEESGNPAGPVIEPLPSPAPPAEPGGGEAQPSAPAQKFATPPPARPARREVVDPFATPPPSDPNTTLDPWRAREISRPAPGAYRTQGGAATGAALPKSNFANEVVEPFTTDMPRKAVPAPAPVPARRAKLTEADDAVESTEPRAPSAAPAAVPVRPAPASVPATGAAAPSRAAASKRAAAPAPAPAAASASPRAPAPAAESEAAESAAAGRNESIVVPAAPSASAGATRGRADSPEDARHALVTLGDRLIEQKNWAQAVVVYRSLIARYPRDPDLAAWKARLQLATEQSSSP
jgi:hypothetical protein